MTRPSRLPGFVRLILRVVLPQDSAEGILADLEDDFSRETGSLRGRHWWLTRQTASLVVAYVGEAPLRILRGCRVLAGDLGHAARFLARRPALCGGSALTLGVGLAAVLVAAGVGRSLLLRPVSPAHADSLVRLGYADRADRVGLRLSYVEWQVFADHVGASATIGAVTMQPAMLRMATASLQTMAEAVTADYSGLVTTAIVAGRGLMAHDDEPGAAPVAVVSETAWREHFGGTPAILGSTLFINNTGFTIVGVTRARTSSSSMGAVVDAWIPAAHADPLLARGWRSDPSVRWWTLVALPGGPDVAELRSHLDGAAKDLAARLPRLWKERRAAIFPGRQLTGNQRVAGEILSSVLGSLAVLILVVAASNVGGLLLTRATSEQRQAAIHLSVGAKRGMLVRRRLAEGVLIGAAGGLAALPMYWWARVRMSEVALQPTLTLRIDLPFDVWTVASAMGGGAVVGFLLALAPAMWALRLDVFAALKDGAARSGSAALPRARRGLVSAQVALSLTLVIGAVLFARGAATLAGLDPGFPKAGLLAMDFDIEPVGLSAIEAQVVARDALDRIGALPGVTGVAMASGAPVDGAAKVSNLRFPGDATPRLEATLTSATDGYFDTVGIPLLQGRGFSKGEAAGGADVAVISDALASELWPSGGALDRALVVDALGRTVRVVGVAKNVKARSLTEQTSPHVYVASAPAFHTTLLIRSTAEERLALRQVQEALNAVGPGVIGFFPRTMDDHLALELLPPRAAASAARVMGAAALALSTVGLYGLVAWFVELRRREIGVRLTLGASSADVRRLVLVQALRSAAPGVLVGLLLAVGLAVLARSALVGVAPLDPAAYAAGLAGMAVIVMAASYWPCRRALRVDPAIALREP